MRIGIFMIWMCYWNMMYFFGVDLVWLCDLYKFDYIWIVMMRRI